MCQGRANWPANRRFAFRGWNIVVSLSLSLSLLLPSLSLLRSHRPRQSKQRFLRNLYCKSMDTADRTWEIGHAPRTISETLTIFCRDKINFIHRLLFEWSEKQILLKSHYFYYFVVITWIDEKLLCLRYICLERRKI